MTDPRSDSLDVLFRPRTVAVVVAADARVGLGARIRNPD